jgi:GNAT superfamily N-acetyltransferase
MVLPSIPIGASMEQLFLRAKTMFLLAKHGEGVDIAREIACRMYSNDASYVLRRDLSIPFTRPSAKRPIIVRPIRDDDIPIILEERPRRLPVLCANIPTCYVATTEDGQLCYMQWLVGAADQEKIRPYFKGSFGRLNKDQVLLEFAYTFKKFRGQGIMAAAMAEIAEKGLLQQARWAITFVQADNIPSLKGCRNAGFSPYMLREEKWRFFHLKQAFRVLPPSAKFSFEEPGLRQQASAG